MSNYPRSSHLPESLNCNTNLNQEVKLKKTFLGSADVHTSAHGFASGAVKYAPASSKFTPADPSASYHTTAHSNNYYSDLFNTKISKSPEHPIPTPIPTSSAQDPSSSLTGHEPIKVGGGIFHRHSIDSANRRLTRPSFNNIDIPELRKPIVSPDELSSLTKHYFTNPKCYNDPHLSTKHVFELSDESSIYTESKNTTNFVSDLNNLIINECDYDFTSPPGQIPSPSNIFEKVLPKQKYPYADYVYLNNSFDSCYGSQPASRDEINPYTNKPYSSNYRKINYSKKDLPILYFYNDFANLILDNQVIIIVGETGSGKSTQIPQWCIQLGLAEKVACTQPRKLAAINLAKRVSDEMDVVLGDEVGYSVRFEDKTSHKTKIKYMTDGRLLRETMSDQILELYGVIILDEIHQRAITTDILMGFIKDIMKIRTDLKLILMSATINPDKFRKYFHNAPLLNIEARRFPVEIYHTEDRPISEMSFYEIALFDCESKICDTVCNKVLEIHRKEGRGDILVFLPGQSDIQYVCQKLSDSITSLGDTVGELDIFPFYRLLTLEEQRRIFNDAPLDRPNGKISRKCIVATNIAESSLTINGIVYVIDCGKSKENIYNPIKNVECLQECDISQESAEQRAGRAGRLTPGKCYRLYPLNTFLNGMPKSNCPEIMRANLASTILQVTKLGYTYLLDFDFLDRPKEAYIVNALHMLYDMDAIGEDGKLTSLGELMVCFPLEPILSKMLIKSCMLECSNEILSIVSVLTISQVFLRPKKGKDAEKADLARRNLTLDGSDHLTLLNVFNQFIDNNESREWCTENFIDYRFLKEATKVKEQLSRILYRKNLLLTSTRKINEYYRFNICQALIQGYSLQIATHEKDEYYKTKNGLARLDRSCYTNYISSPAVAKPRHIIYHEMKSINCKMYLRCVTDISEIYPLLFPSSK